MKRSRRKNIEFVKSLLDKPVWYNQAITHPNWPLIKRAIAKQGPIPMISMPPVIEDNLDKLQSLRNWQRSAAIYAILPPVTVIGATNA